MESSPLQLIDISKSFGATKAVDHVTATFTPGTITALLGENGAGKTTLMRIVAGFLRPDHGVARVGQRELHLTNHAVRREVGIEMVQQHFALAAELTIAENIALADPNLPPFISREEVESRAVAAIERSGVTLDRVARRVSRISVGERAKVDLVKALLRNPSILILDEPTSVLSPPEVQDLVRVLRQRAASGTIVIVITHKLPEVFTMSDEIVVMRSGRIVLRAATSTTSREAIAREMSNVDSSPADRNVPRNEGATVLELQNVSSRRAEERVSLRDVAMQVRSGAVTAIVGAAGNGQEELASVLRGLSQVSSGEILLRGGAVSPRELFRDARIAHVPADRTGAAVVRGLSITEHLALRSGATGSAAVMNAQRAIVSYSIRASSPRQDVTTLSGGNQQKVVVARELGERPDVIIASEPTRGLDLESAKFIRQRLSDAAEAGSGVLLITSDLDEALEIAGAVYVIYRGALSGPFAPADIDTISRRLGGIE